MKLPRQLLQIDYDQFHRYAAVTVLLKPLLEIWSKNSTRPLRILEVGSHSLNLLPAFLSPLPVEMVRADLEPQYAGDVGPYVTIKADEPFPFQDGSFDVTVAMEVLEHIPASSRRFAMSEWARVATKSIVFTCPNGNRVCDIERRADADFQARHGRVHPWLEEHQRFGRPTQEDVEKLCTTLGLTCHQFNNSPLAEWLPLLLATEQIFEHGDQELLARFNEMLNSGSFNLLLYEQGYRCIYAAFKSKQIDQEAQQLWTGTKQPDGLRSLDPVRMLAKRLSQYLISQRRREVDANTLQAALDEAAQYRQRLGEAELQLAWERWQVVKSRRGGFRVWQQKPFEQKKNPLGSSKLFNLKSFGQHHWQVCGASPAFEWPCHHDRGWHRVVVQGQVEPRQSARLALDYGNGLNDVHVIRLGKWRAGYDQLAVNVYFHHPVQTLRLIPCSFGRQVVIENLAITPISSGRVALQGLARIIKELFSEPKSAWRLLKRSPSWLRLGMRLTTKPRRLPCWEREPEAQILAEREAWRQERRLMLEKHRLNQSKVVVFLRLDHLTSPKSMQSTLESLMKLDSCRWEIWCAASHSQQAEWNTNPVFCQLGNRLQWIDDAADRGLAGLLNECAQTSQGDWLIYLQVGDEVMPECFIQVLETVKNNPKSALIYADEATRSADGKELELIIKPAIALHELRADPSILGCAYAVHVPTLLKLGGFHPCYEGALALEYLCRLLKAQLPISQITSVLLHHAPRPPMSSAVLKVVERIFEEYDGEAYEISHTKVTDQIDARDRFTDLQNRVPLVSQRDGASC